MNIQEIAKIVSQETGQPYYKVMPIISATVSVIRKQILKSQIIKLATLLTIYADVSPARDYYDIGKDKKMTLPRRFVLKIIPSIGLKKEINAKKTY